MFLNLLTLYVVGAHAAPSKDGWYECEGEQCSVQQMTYVRRVIADGPLKYKKRKGVMKPAASAGVVASPSLAAKPLKKEAPAETPKKEAAKKKALGGQNVPR